MFASRKHCVAIGGTACAIVGTGAEVKFNAEAAAGGICIPVP